MDMYSLLREIAHGWVLVATIIVFIGVVIFTYRPGSRELHDDISQIPFRNEKPGE